MNTGVIVSDNISVLSKIFLKIKKDKIVFSSKSPLCIKGFLEKDKKYKFKLLIPVCISDIKTFNCTHCDECIKIQLCDIADENSNLCVYFHIKDRVQNHCKMYCLETVVTSDVCLCDPVMFIRGTVVRGCCCLDKYMDKDSCKNICVKLFIEKCVE